MRDAAALLSELQRLIPPDSGNHAILLSPDGILTVQVRHHRMGQPFYLDAADLNRTPGDVAAEIADIVRRNFARIERIG